MTEETARNYMMHWDKRFLNKLKILGIHVRMNKRYVYDILALLDSIRKGWKYCPKSNKMEYEIPNHHEEQEGDEERTLRTLREIADSLEPNIQFTTDVPSNHQDGKMPVLDIKVWMRNVEGKQTLLHTFY